MTKFKSLSSDRVYVVTSDGFRCNCPSFEHRGFCRHVRMSLRAQSLGLPSEVHRTQLDLEQTPDVCQMTKDEIQKWPAATLDYWLSF